MEEFKIYDTYKEFKEDFKSENYDWLDKKDNGEFIKTFHLEKYIDYLKNHLYFLKKTLLLCEGKKEIILEKDELTDFLNDFNITDEELYNNSEKNTGYYLKMSFEYTTLMYYSYIRNFIEYNEYDKWFFLETKYRLHIITINKIISELEEMLLFHFEGLDKETQKEINKTRKKNTNDFYAPDKIYLLERLGVLDKMNKMNLSQRKQYEIISLLTGTNSDNIKKNYYKPITDKTDPKRLDRLKKVDDFLE